MAGSRRGGCFATPAREMRERTRRHEEEKARTPFDLMTTAELRVWAQKFDIKNYGKLKKPELCKAVRLAYEGSVK
jgi:hypothetical protein